MIPPIINQPYIAEIKEYKKNNNEPKKTEPKEKEEVEEVKVEQEITGWPPHVHFGD